MTPGISGFRPYPLLERDGQVSLAFAAHQPVVAVEQNIGRQVFRIGFVNHIEIPCGRRIAETVVGGVQYQQSARLQAAGEIAHDALKGIEVQNGIAALGCGGGEVAIDQHRQAEDGVIGAGGFALRRRRNLEGHVRGLLGPHARIATGDVARVDVDALEDGGGKILAQAEHFFAARAAERQYAQVRSGAEALGRKSEQPWVSIRPREIVGLEFTRHRPPEYTAQRVPNVPERVAAPARDAFEGDPNET